jgi:hypothetical protein
MKQLLEELRLPAEPQERRDYLPDYPGFEPAFRAKIRPAPNDVRLDLPVDLDGSLSSSDVPHRVLAKALTDGLDELATRRTSFNVVVFYLPQRWLPMFTADGFHLHDHVKAHAAALGLRTQILTDEALNYRCRASVRWRLGTALYAKAGGTPYKLAPGGLLSPHAAYLGIAYGVRDAGTDEQQFVTCCSQMFDSQGGGLEFIAHDMAGDVDARNPYLSRDQMRGVINRTLAVYADQHAGRRPGQLVVHKQTPFTKHEVAGTIDAWGKSTELSCISLTKPNWRAVLVTGMNPRTTVPQFGYAIDRGTLVQLDDYTGLLWVAGNAKPVTQNGRNYLQGGKGTPRPLLISRHVGYGPLLNDAAQVLALSKMDWNSDSLYSALPATITYAQVLSRIVKTERIPNVPYDFRLFM